MRRKVLFVPSWYPAENDPVSGVFIQEQAVALAKDYDVAVLIPGLAAWRNLANPRSSDRTSKVNQEGLPVYREFARPLIPHGPEISAYQAFLRAADKGFRRLLSEWGSPDVIHTHVVLPAGWTAMRLGKRYSVPVVLTEHSSPFSMHLGTKLSQRLVRDTLTQVDRLIAISPALAEQLLTFEPELNVAVVGEAVKTDFFVPGNGDSTQPLNKRFFAAARLAEQKGLSHLIEAVQLLAQRGLNSFELVIGGDGPDRLKLEQLAKSLGVSERCRFLGALDREQVKQGMQRCDVFVLSSLHETFGVVVGEAMACGKPVIATRCGGPEFVVTEETGILVKVGSAEALAEAMSDFITGRVNFDPVKVRESVVSRFGPTAFVRNISRVYDELW